MTNLIYLCSTAFNFGHSCAILRCRQKNNYNEIVFGHIPLSILCNCEGLGAVTDGFE